MKIWKIKEIITDDNKAGCSIKYHFVINEEQFQKYIDSVNKAEFNLPTVNIEYVCEIVDFEEVKNMMTIAQYEELSSLDLNKLLAEKMVENDV